MKPIASYPLRVYIEDTDCNGIVYHANFLKFMERARSEWLYSLGFDEQSLLAMRVGFVIRTAEVEYFLPARVGSQLQVDTFVKEVKRSSVEFFQKIVNTATNELLCSGKILVVVINEKFRPAAIPIELLNHFKEESIDA